MNTTMHGVTRVTAKHRNASADHAAYSVATISDDRGGTITLFVSAAQADAIAAAFAPVEASHDDA